MLYFGTVCDPKGYDEVVRKCKRKPSVAPIVFESALLSGFKKLGVDMEIYSFPMVPDFFKSKVVGWNNKKDALSCGYTATWIPTVNVPLLKQFSRSFNSKRIIKKWLKKTTGKDRAVLIYSVCPYIAPHIVKLCKKANVSCFVIVADLPVNMFLNRKYGKLKSFVTKLYLSPAIKAQGQFDGYVYLTKHMRDAVNDKAPYVIVEGIADTALHDNTLLAKKDTTKAIMYAGGLNEKYGVGNLIEAVLNLPYDNVELWLFGTGNYVDKVEEYAKQYPSICYGGRISHDEVLEYERKASLLVNIRSTDDEYTKYSFPSKTIEYMLSGTPVLSTRLPGIPDEYEDYIYMIDNNDVSNVSCVISNILKQDEATLREFGLAAREFVLKEKNSEIQAHKIIDLIIKVKK